MWRQSGAILFLCLGIYHWHLGLSHHHVPRFVQARWVDRQPSAYASYGPAASPGRERKLEWAEIDSCLESVNDLYLTHFENELRTFDRKEHSIFTVIFDVPAKPFFERVVGVEYQNTEDARQNLVEQASHWLFPELGTHLRACWQRTFWYEQNQGADLDEEQRNELRAYQRATERLDDERRQAMTALATLSGIENERIEYLRRWLYRARSLVENRASTPVLPATN